MIRREDQVPAPLTSAGRPVVALGLLGAGGQGEVWRCRVDGGENALKLYHASTSTPAQRAALERLVGSGPPAPAFLWPEALVEGPDGRTGYLMPLREPRFRAADDLLTRRAAPTMRALAAAGFHLADAFLQLHARGLCYRDVSFGNVFVDPATGEVRVCDNDNVEVDGAATGGVLGTPRFMAPEVVRGEASPSADTDRFSLAVLLFYLLYGGHPLEGRLEAAIHCLDLPAMNRLYGSAPVYVFDPADDTNRPVPGIHDNVLAFDAVWPSAIRALFARSFGEGLRLPARRVRESEWRRAFAGLLDAAFPCGCGAWVFWDAEGARVGRDGACWRCGQRPPEPRRMRLDRQVLVLAPGARLRPHHLGEALALDEVVGEVVRHPSDPSRLGLRNLGATPWTLRRPDGSSAEVPPGRAAEVVAGARLELGTVTGEVR